MKLRNVLLSVFALSFSTLSFATPVLLDFEANHYEGTQDGGRLYSGFRILGGSYSEGFYSAIEGQNSIMFGQNNYITIMKKDSSLFDLSSFLVRQYDDGQDDYSLAVIVEGYTKGTKTHYLEMYVNANDLTAYKQELSFLGVDRIVFRTDGHVGTAFLDNLSLNTNPINPVPEPSTYAMMLAGLGMVGVMIKRRRASSQV